MRHRIIFETLILDKMEAEGDIDRVGQEGRKEQERKRCFNFPIQFLNKVYKVSVSEKGMCTMEY